MPFSFKVDTTKPNILAIQENWNMISTDYIWSPKLPAGQTYTWNNVEKISIGDNISLTFDKTIKFKANGKIKFIPNDSIYTLTYTSTTPIVEQAIENNNTIIDKKLTIKIPSNLMTDGRIYKLVIEDNSIQDLAGNLFTGMNNYYFAVKDTTNPKNFNISNPIITNGTSKVKIIVPIDNDKSLIGGKVQLQFKNESSIEWYSGNSVDITNDDLSKNIMQYI